MYRLSLQTEYKQKIEEETLNLNRIISLQQKFKEITEYKKIATQEKNSGKKSDVVFAI